MLMTIQPIIDAWNAPKIQIDNSEPIDLEGKKARRFDFWIQNMRRKPAKDLKVEMRFEGIKNESKNTFPEMQYGAFVIAENYLLPSMHGSDQRIKESPNFEIYYDIEQGAFSLAWTKETRQGDDILIHTETRALFPVLIQP